MKHLIKRSGMTVTLVFFFAHTAAYGHKDSSTSCGRLTIDTKIHLMDFNHKKLSLGTEHFEESSQPVTLLDVFGGPYALFKDSACFTGPTSGVCSLLGKMSAESQKMYEKGLHQKTEMLNCLTHDQRDSVEIQLKQTSDYDESEKEESRLFSRCYCPEVGPS